ncbi:class I SAM-dependent methyltransferase [Pleomorphovibrio marinus]|uniref:class I SAM-dependent methyltransferase n=1 Tax=Pleomorphovibrio marinus TaxID=2164132 RepID=UPI000E0C7B76|nr:class I SAM-dependent methyltransferase [Pleomorphovibrio marinus]
MTKDIAQFYDEFADKQVKIGVNSRHYSILDKVVKAGFTNGHNVLEIGCGIGTVSQLLARKTPKGEVLAVDISPESIAKAKQIWSKQKNLSFEISDMKGFNKPNCAFDFVVLPDVLEHIPEEEHIALFKTILKHSHDHTVVFIHIPSPRFLEWMIRNEANKLQVIDQPIDTGKLVSHLATCGFYLDKMETYSIYYKEKDYQYFVFRRESEIKQVTHLNKWKILGERIKFRMSHRL